MSTTAVGSADAETIKNLYAALAKGDVPAILEMMSEDVSDDDGKISRLRHYVDTAKHIAASQGEDTTAG